ncbi:MAG: nicotinate-nucleotide--dimethylbenzimidazole phosphoribosyltransferase [Thiotrichales bacterium 34-46-19]|nr:MAG: nicotinate-nucleotide--dimethylbenzimidazole phosphoribosyltransferase [Thiotrichales bacterium 17-46-47]OZA97304.1 MAG: nicotinate-nucleotide--dimethylbenzimidazole phosphoribosyltransferase [Thiotrichales bacterium 34-46-19]HQT02272.1 nicotinate-nucleotide--dimethylbenzimidazole phosphoribosyltransferase [Thiotrichales bacterium]HQT04511.1 nicotinate-nucleotide--dimethylbenzimidazole phosphoribosyltransferase [Thiotrichales bacterium]
MNWTLASSAILCTASREAAIARQAVLTKPAGSLGQLESIAIQLAAMQGTDAPSIQRPYIAIFAGDHGIAAEGVSAFPQVVTGEMIRNFARGGAAISVLAKAQDALLHVYNCGTAYPIEPLTGVTDRSIAAGTFNFLQQAAMTETQCSQALAIGKEAVENALAQGCDLFIAGEMGIANTTPATAIASTLLSVDPAQITGRGTGIDDAVLAHKIEVIRQGIERHQIALTSPLRTLQYLGGFEIAAIAGAYIAAAQAGLPILIDGFISSAAALVAVKHNPSVRDWMLFAHASAEPGHATMMQALAAKPLLDLGMRLGEGSGAGVAISLLRLACDLHNQMATFADAGISNN